MYIARAKTRAIQVGINNISYKTAGVNDWFADPGGKTIMKGWISSYHLFIN